jgi:cellobiose transport system permease protein
VFAYRRWASRRVEAVVVYTGMTLLAVVVLFPFYWMLIASTRSTADLTSYPPYLLPGSLLRQNFQELFAKLPVLRAFVNSLFIASTHTALVLFFCSLGGFGFAKYQFPGRDKLFVLLLSTMMIPAAIAIIPWYIMMTKFGWINDYKALIIPGSANAFGIFWMRQYIAGSVPDELLQAARIDGAGDWGIYWRIVVPLIRPALGTLGLLSFMWTWNDFMAPFIILNDPLKFTLPLILGLLQNQYGTNLNYLMAGATLATVPILAVFVMMSRQFIGGLTAGALKG